MDEDSAKIGDPIPGRLTTQQVADRLNVKVETVYAYASRGLLTSRRLTRGKGSTFDVDEVETLAAGRERSRSSPVVDTGPLVHTALTLIENGRLYYRGADAVELSTHLDFESVAGRLWGVGADQALEMRVPAAVMTMLQRSSAGLPEQVRLTDRLRISVAIAASADPLRFDLSESAVRATAAGLLATMVDSLPQVVADSESTPPSRTLAARLWTRLSPRRADPQVVDCLNQALVLLADHDLAVSTVAARVAASARAHPYAVVSAGLGALDGPLHGAASGLAHRMLGEVLTSGNAGLVVSEYLRNGRYIPGLGHSAYPGGDPRARALLTSLARIDGAARVVQAVEAVEEAATGSTSPKADIDLALAAFAHATQMPAEAGEVIFAIARTAGWIAHALEEYGESPLRMRAHGVYTGPRPPRPVST